MSQVVGQIFEQIFEQFFGRIGERSEHGAL